MILDCHWHITFDNYEENVKKSILEIKRCGINRCALMFSMGLYLEPDALRAQGEALQEMVAKYGEHFIPFFVIDPNLQREVIKRAVLDYIVNGPAVAVKVHHSMVVRRREFEPLASILSEYDIPVLIHCWYKTVQKYKDETDPSDIAVLAQKFPKLRIIMAHLTGCGERGVQDIEPHENVWIDTSGSQPEAGHMEYAMQTLGADRIVYGSDYGGRDPATQIARIYSMDMKKEDRHKILYGNSEKLFRGCLT